MAKNTLGDCSKEIVEKNFLLEDPDMSQIPTTQKVVVAQEVPKTQKIIFTNNRDPGCTLYFHYASKTHPLLHYTLMHGQEHELPIEVINHLEGQTRGDPYACHRRLYGKRMRADGVTEVFENGYVPYFRCQPVRA